MCDGVLYLGVEKDVSWMSIPAGTNTRKHGWRDVVSLMDWNQVPDENSKLVVNLQTSGLAPIASVG